ncbi:regulatory protein RecX [Microbacterium suwonense]|nr:regulatory protein RecX [Microbacterium suwonense]
MGHSNGGEEHLAPVIPIFGADRDSGETRPDLPRRTGDEGLWRSALSESRGRVTALPTAHAEDVTNEAPDHATEDPDEARRRAEEVLVRRLRSRQLSVSEARSVLRESRADRESIEQIIDEFVHRGYLDDRTLAQLLVTSGVERKGQGRIALSRALSQRGIPREIITQALEELPDDDADRALEYARSKAPAMTRLEPETALRRLLGQLARRGYAGSVAMNAARTALSEAGSGRSGVRFVESD